MLTLTTAQLFQSFAAFAALVAQKISNPRLAYNLSKTWKQVQEEVKSLREQEQAIFHAFGAEEVLQDNGAKALSVDVKKMDEATRESFDAQLKQLQEITIELWGHPLTLAEIETAKLELSPNDFLLLDWLIIEEAAAVEKPKAESAVA